MDNPQHYQPLSHALIQPTPAQQIYPANGSYHRSSVAATAGHVAGTHHREEEEEDDDEDEGMVEDHLQQRDDNPSHNSPKPKASGSQPSRGHASSSQQQLSQQETEKRRPGRPKGSKNRKIRSTSGPTPTQPGSSSTQVQTLSANSSTATAPPQLPEVNAQNQQYYEFQWRVLNLCAEFYGAAEELVKGTPPLVVAQCYQMGPGSKVDPLVMLNDAKRVCDTLLANPSRLISSPPPPMYTVIPTLYPPQPMPTNASAGPSSTPATNGAPPATSPPTVITNPQSFVVSLGAQGAYPHSPYAPIYGSQYAPYYPYSYPPGTAYFSAPPQQPVAPGNPAPTTSSPIQVQPQPPAQAPQTPAQPQPQPPQHQPSQPPQPQSQPQHQPQQQSQSQSQQPSQSTTPSATTPTMTSTTPSGISNPTMITGVGPGMQGSWSDEEVDRLRRLAEDSKSYNSAGEIDWDWLCRQWGHGRTRHQILIKATSLGLKESTGRGVKRRRDTEAAMEVSSSSIPTTPHTANANIPSNIPGPDIAAASASPAMSHATTTPTASPAMQNQPRPVAPPSKLHNSSSHSKYSATTSPSLPYPMPHVASSNAPVISTAPGAVDSQQRMSYYRQQRTGSEPKHSAQSEMPPSKHPFMYQPPSGSSRMKDK
ncbi:hypothetical protein PTI98_009763 [Pleurotus ostreatus]|nr:hypothetical protein PTI98_009763 [Pleurotus ostreatus]